jgi:hypothetical protein
MKDYGNGVTVTGGIIRGGHQDYPVDKVSARQYVDGWAISNGDVESSINYATYNDLFCVLDWVRRDPSRGYTRPNIEYIPKVIEFPSRGEIVRLSVHKIWVEAQGGFLCDEKRQAMEYVVRDPSCSCTYYVSLDVFESVCWAIAGEE